MKHRNVLGTCIAGALGLSLHANGASGERSLKDGLVGTWTVISWEQKKNDGTTFQKRFVAISGDQLTLTIRPPSGETVDVVWTRAK